MAEKKKSTKKVKDEVVEEVKEVKTATKTETKKAVSPKYEVGSIVYISKDTLSDLNGFNLSISQYRKDTYTVEAYDANTGVYTLRHLKLLLKLKEGSIVAPDENAHDHLSRKQF